MNRRYISGSVSIRPVNVGFAIERTPEAFRSAVQTASAHWGGLYWPIVPVEKPEEAVEALRCMGVDVVATVGEVPGVANFAKRAQLVWQGGHREPFDEPAFMGAPAQIWPMLRTAVATRPSVQDVLTPVVWEDSRPDANYLAATYGEYSGEYSPDVAEITRLAGVQPIEIADAGMPPTDMRSVPIRSTTLQLRPPFDGDLAIAIVDPEAIEDLAAFWTMRALGDRVCALPRCTDAFADSVAADRIRQHLADPRTKRDDSLVVQVWKREDDSTAEIHALVAEIAPNARVLDLSLEHVTRLRRRPLPSTDLRKSFTVEIGESKMDDIPLPDIRSMTTGSGRPSGHVVAEVHYSTQWNLPLGKRASLPPARRFSRAILPIPIPPLHPFANPIRDGVAIAVNAISDSVSTRLISSYNLLEIVVRDAEMSAQRTQNSRRTHRLIELLGGGHADSSANQPAVREVLLSAARTHVGKGFPALKEVADKNSGAWPESFGARGTDYGRDVIGSLVKNGLLPVHVTFDCLSCESGNSQPAEQTSNALTCDLCRESIPLGSYLVADRAPKWCLALPVHLQADHLSELFPVMAALSNIACLPGFDPSGTPHAVIGVEFDLGGSKTEVDLVVITEESPPTLMLCEAKAAGELNMKDFDGLVNLQERFRSAGIDAYIMVSKMRADLSAYELERLRGMCDNAQLAVETASGGVMSPVFPIIFLEQDLSVHSFHEEHPVRGEGDARSVASLAVSTCKRHLGLGDVAFLPGKGMTPIWQQ